MSLSTRDIITNLSNSSRSILNSDLIALSNLNSEELNFFEQEWVAIELKRQRHIIYRLVELAESSFELDFNSIFRNHLNDPDANIRCKAIEGLWESEEPSLIDSLINLLEQDSSEEVQAAAATALGKFAMLAEDKKLRSYYTSKIEQALFGIIDDSNKPIEVKRHALEATAPLSLPQVQRAIIQAYQSPNTKVRISAIYAMGKNCSPYWLPTLLKELDSTDADVRYEAVTACGEIEKEEAVPYIIKHIDDPDVDVQLAAIQALGKIGGTEAKNCLEHCLNNPNEIISYAAEQALYELQGGEDPLSFNGF